MTLVYLARTLIDGTGSAPHQDAMVIVQNGRFVRVGARSDGIPRDPDVKVVDVGDGVLMPGLIDLHSHLFLMEGKSHVIPGYQETLVRYIARGLANARLWLEKGVTTVREVGVKTNLDLELRDLIEADGAIGPRIFASGSPITMTAGLRGSAAAMALEVDGADQARKAARLQLRAGVDHLKLFATAGVGGGEGRLIAASGWAQLTQEEIQAACDEAHKAGRRVAVHAIGTEGIKNAIRGGADTIEHGSFLDEEAIDLMLEHRTALVPTLAIRHNLAYNAVARGYQAHIGQKALESLPFAIASHSRAYQRGVPIGVGTDNVEGDTVAQECRILHEKVGMSTADVIRAATLGNAELIGVSDWLGSVEPGKVADFIVLQGNPLENISALERVTYVVKQGKVQLSA